MLLSQSILSEYNLHKEKTISGRYIHFSLIKDLLVKNKSTKIGTSELNNPIHAITFGNGNKKILIWSQMHGNESTGTKAIFDLLNYLQKANNRVSEQIKQQCQIVLIPMLNPDGALAYTRVNANGVDLNRDALALEAKESKVLRKTLEEFNPDFCFNLHDQRSIFGVEGTKKSAVVSFLAPSISKAREITTGRKKTMNVIAAIYDELNQYLPNQIGRYTDDFYPTATGDNFQKMGYNTVLVESGHYPNDYEREVSRKCTFLSILKGLHHIAHQKSFIDEGSYFSIPNNAITFFDVIHRYQSKPDKAFHYEEKIVNGKFSLLLKQVKDLDAKNYFAHKEIVFVD